MKIMYPNRVASVTAATEATEYPAANLLDSKPQKVWKALVGSSTLTIITNGSVSGIFVCNCNANTYVLTIKNVAGTVTYWTTADANYSPSDAAFIGGRIFVEFPSTYVNPVKIELLLEQEFPTEVVYAGILRCGPLISLPDPEYGLKSERQDFSIKSEMSNGGLYVYTRQTPRSYDLSFLATHPQFETIDGLYSLVSSAPVPILISDNLERPDYWSGFFHISDPPSGSYAYPNHIDCAFSLREAV